MLIVTFVRLMQVVIVVLLFSSYLAALYVRWAMDGKSRRVLLTMETLFCGVSVGYIPCTCCVYSSIFW
jgi:hypothetical protein